MPAVHGRASGGAGPSGLWPGSTAGHGGLDCHASRTLTLWLIKIRAVLKLSVHQNHCHIGCHGFESILDLGVSSRYPSRVVDRTTELRWQLDQNCADKRKLHPLFVHLRQSFLVAKVSRSATALSSIWFFENEAILCLFNTKVNWWVTISFFKRLYVQVLNDCYLGASILPWHGCQRPVSSRGCPIPPRRHWISKATASHQNRWKSLLKPLRCLIRTKMGRLILGLKSYFQWVCSSIHKYISVKCRELKIALRALGFNTRKSEVLSRKIIFYKIMVVSWGFDFYAQVLALMAQIDKADATAVDFHDFIEVDFSVCRLIFWGGL